MEQAYGNGLDTRFSYMFDNAVDRGIVQRGDYLAFRIEALRYLEAELAWHERCWLFKLKIVQRGPYLAGDFEHVAKALGGNECRLCQLALDNGVGGDSGCMHHVLYGFRRNPAVHAE